MHALSSSGLVWHVRTASQTENKSGVAVAGSSLSVQCQYMLSVHIASVVSVHSVSGVGAWCQRCQCIVSVVSVHGVSGVMA